jgi:hypothetical protein
MYPVTVPRVREKKLQDGHDIRTLKTDTRNL